MGLKRPSRGRRRSRARRFPFLWLSLVFLVPLSLIVVSEIAVNRKTRGRTFDDPERIPGNRVGLLLGTSRRVVGGQPNLFFQNRIGATRELFDSGKISFVLVSGDNRRKYYNEPLEMKRELVKAGVPERKIYMDFAGFSTLDSVVRVHEVFGQKSFTVISQKFQNRRAVYIAMKKGLDAIAFNALDVPFGYGIKTWLRERPARLKMFADLWIGTQPHFLGEPVVIE